MSTFIALAVHDREDWLQRTLAALSYAGAPYTLAICANGCDFDPSPYLKRADVAIETPDKLGPAGARNELLKHREPGQDVLFLDADVVFTTRGWLQYLTDTLYSNDSYGAISPAMKPEGLRPFHGIEPNTGLHLTQNLPVGARLAKGVVMDGLGALRIYGAYGCEDLDFDCRTQCLGYQLLYDSSVVVEHPGVPADDAWKRQMLEDCIQRFKQWEQHYRTRRYLHIPLDLPQVPLPSMMSTQTDVEYGSHLPVLKWAVGVTEGPILELGGGIYSTPYLHETGREVVTVERNKRWREYIRHWEAPYHRIVEEPPALGHFGLVFVDNEEDRRVPDLKWLRGRFDMAVCHDTEPTAWAKEIVKWDDILPTFPHSYQYQPEGVPWTTVVSDSPLPPVVLDESKEDPCQECQPSTRPSRARQTRRSR